MAMDTLAEFQDLGLYKTFLKAEFQKLMLGEPEPCFLSREEIVFEDGDEGFVFLVGAKGGMAAKALKSRAGLKFYNGTCTLNAEGAYEVDGIDRPIAKKVKPLLRKLALSSIQLIQTPESLEPRETEVESPAELETAVDPTAQEPLPAESVSDSWEEALRTYFAAAESADAELRELGAKLTQTGDPDLRQIATRDLRGVLGASRTPLLAALRELEAPNTRAGAARRARPLLTRYAAYLRADPRVAACDSNPFGVRVTLRKELGGALDRLERALGQLG